MLTIKVILRGVYRALPFKAPILGFLRDKGFLRRISSRLKGYLVFSGPFVVQVKTAKFFMLLGYGREIEASIFWDGIDAFESTTIKWWCELSKRSTYILDIGANTGIYSLVANALNPSAEIYAFEPIERIHKILDENIRLNTPNLFSPMINAYRVALSDYSGQGNMFDLPVEHIYTASLNRNVHAERGQLMQSTQEAVAVLRLDDFISQQRIGGLDLIKIDVESHESEVLRGMGDYLYKFHPSMIIEIWNNEVGAKVESVLADCNYIYFALVTANPTQTPHIRNDFPARGFINYLVCTPEVAKAIGLLT